MDILIFILKVLFYAISAIVAFYFLLSPLLFIAYYLKGGLKKRFTHNPAGKQYEFAAIITAHQDARFIAPFVDSFLKQAYPHFKKNKLIRILKCMWWPMIAMWKTCITKTQE